MSGFCNELTQMLICSRILSAVELKYDPLECKVGRDGQNSVDEMNAAGGFAHSYRLSHHLYDLVVGKVVKSSNTDDMIEGLSVEFESRAVHDHEPAIEMGARHLDIIRIDVYSGILASEAASIVAWATSEIQEILTEAWIYLLADQRAKPVGRRP